MPGRSPTSRPEPPRGVPRPPAARRSRRLSLVAASTAAALALLAAGCDIGPWHQVGTEYLANPLLQGQGLATVIAPDDSTTLVYDGISTVPADLQNAGWDHVGDPDSSQGYIFRAFQNASSSAGKKLFRATTPGGTSYDYVHTYASGEIYNNSFAAVSPDSQWLVSGEWGSMTHLLVFPTPVLNPATSPTGGALPLAGRINLDTTVVDLQGCTFVTDTRLLCSSDDPVTENGIPRKSLLQVDLPHPLDGNDIAGAVTALGPIPLTSDCAVTAPGSWPDDFEVEGVDYDRVHARLRVLVIPPGTCAVAKSAALVFALPE